MKTLRYAGDRLQDLGNSFFNQSPTSGDLVFVTTEGSVRAHRLLLVGHLPVLMELLCEDCCKHQERVVFLPGVRLEDLKAALEDLYLRNKTQRLKAIFIDFVQDEKVVVKVESVDTTDAEKDPYDLKEMKSESEEEEGDPYNFKDTLDEAVDELYNPNKALKEASFNLSNTLDQAIEDIYGSNKAMKKTKRESYNQKEITNDGPSNPTESADEAEEDPYNLKETQTADEKCEPKLTNTISAIEKDPYNFKEAKCETDKHMVKETKSVAEQDEDKVKKPTDVPEQNGKDLNKITDVTEQDGNNLKEITGVTENVLAEARKDDATENDKLSPDQEARTSGGEYKPSNEEKNLKAIAEKTRSDGNNPKVTICVQRNSMESEGEAKTDDIDEATISSTDSEASIKEVEINPAKNIEVNNDSKSDQCNLSQSEELPSITDEDEFKLNFEKFHFANNDIIYWCVTCSAQISTKTEAAEHMKIHRKADDTANETDLEKNKPKEKSKSDEIKEWKCALCDYKSPIRPKMMRHRTKHTTSEFSSFLKFSSDGFVAKINSKNKIILKCRKCKKNCKSPSGAKQHSKACKKTTYLIPLPKQPKKIIKQNITPTVPKRTKKAVKKNSNSKIEKVPLPMERSQIKIKSKQTIKSKHAIPQRNDDEIQEVYNSKTYIAKVAPKLNNLKNLTLTVGNKVMGKTSERSEIVINLSSCPFCNKVCQSKVRLKRHIQLNHQDKIGKVSPEDFLSKGKKISFEGNKKVFKCDKCQKKCKTASGITRHQKMSPKCAPTDNASLGIHVQCEQCNKMCTSDKYLKFHKNVKHGPHTRPKSH